MIKFITKVVSSIVTALVIYPAAYLFMFLFFSTDYVDHAEAFLAEIWEE